MEEIQHLSYSSVSLYQSCPAAWKFRYIDKVPTKTSVNLVFGSAWHGAIEMLLTNRSADPHSVWNEHWETQLNKNKDIDWGMDDPETYFNDGIRMLDAQETKDLIKNLEVQEVEKFVKLKVPGVPIPVIGYIDVITKDGIPGDFKTSSKSWSQERATGELQPLFYLAALNQEKIPTPGWRFTHYIFVKTKTPKVQVVSHGHNVNEMMFLFGMIKNVWQAITSKAFPENPTTWKCDPRWCEYWSVCRGKYE